MINFVIDSAVRYNGELFSLWNQADHGGMSIVYSLYVAKAGSRKEVRHYLTCIIACDNTTSILVDTNMSAWTWSHIQIARAAIVTNRIVTNRTTKIVPRLSDG